MSKSKEDKLIKKNIKNHEKNSQFNDYKLISYRDSNKTKELYNWMKKGYEEMATINLQYAEEAISFGLYDELEYETWLCGV